MDFQKGFSQLGRYGAVNGICICDFSTCSPIIPIAAVQTWSRWQMVLINRSLVVGPAMVASIS